MNFTFDDVSVGFWLGTWKAFQFLRAGALCWLFRIIAKDGKYPMPIVWVGAIACAGILGLMFGDPNNHVSSDDDNRGYGDDLPEAQVTQDNIRRNEIAIFVGAFCISAIGILSAHKPKPPSNPFDQPNYGRYSTLLALALFLFCLSGCSQVAYRGQVSEIRSLRGGMVIDLDGMYPDQRMTLYISNANIDKMGVSIPMVSQNVSIKGSITQYHGRPEIVVTSPDQFVY